jgi:hypothetical protein
MVLRNMQYDRKGQSGAAKTIGEARDRACRKQSHNLICTLRGHGNGFVNSRVYTRRDADVTDGIPEFCRCDGVTGEGAFFSHSPSPQANLQPMCELHPSHVSAMFELEMAEFCHCANVLDRVRILHNDLAAAAANQCAKEN